MVDTEAGQQPGNERMREKARSEEKVAGRQIQSWRKEGSSLCETVGRMDAEREREDVVVSH
jgi:hypothetical protein